MNILIIYYNTQKLTDALIESINKHVSGDVRIYIFDNSDKTPFANKYENVTVFDNTTNKIINFNEILKNYPNRHKSFGRYSNFASFKHCISVNKCFELINDNFILLDSDVLLKKDISEIYDEKYIFTAEVRDWSWNISGIRGNQYPVYKRAMPFLCFINVRKCHELNITFFDDKHMVGLYNPNINADSYDTGAWFFEQCKQYDYREIKYDDYIVHFGGGSYMYRGKVEKISQREWLQKYSSLYTADKPANEMPHDNVIEQSQNNIKYNIVNKKIVIYTSIIGAYDSLLTIQHYNPRFRYVCITDDLSLVHKQWDMIYISNPRKLTNYKLQRYIKMHPHEYFKDYDISIYVDANITIKTDLNKFIDGLDFDNYNIFIFKHPVRTCIYKEAQACVLYKKEKKVNVDRQTDSYRREGYPVNYGLTQNNVIVRRHNDEDCIKLMDAWWEQIVKFTHRDQLSLFYCIWKMDYKKLCILPKMEHLSNNNFRMGMRHIPYKPKTVNKRNIVIINNDQQDDVAKCIESINDTNANFFIYVFDISRKSLFNNRYKNVIVLNNMDNGIMEITDHDTDICYPAILNKCHDILHDGFIYVNCRYVVKEDFSVLYNNAYKILVNKDNVYNVFYINMPYDEKFDIKCGINEYIQKILDNNNSLIYRSNIDNTNIVINTDKVYNNKFVRKQMIHLDPVKYKLIRNGK